MSVQPRRLFQKRFRQAIPAGSPSLLSIDAFLFVRRLREQFEGVLSRTAAPDYLAALDQTVMRPMYIGMKDVEGAGSPAHDPPTIKSLTRYIGTE